MATVGFDVRKIFVDRLLVEKKIDQATAKNAGRAGTIVRRDARASIKIAAPTAKQEAKLNDPDPAVRARAAKSIERRQAKRSQPGGPPLARTRHKSRTIRNIQYGYDPAKKSLVAGPVPIGGSKRLGSQTVPQGLEEGGGSLKITEVNIGTRKEPVWLPRSSKKRGPRVRQRTVRIGARPTMAPALARKKSEMLRTWEGSVR